MEDDERRKNRIVAQDLISIHVPRVEDDAGFYGIVRRDFEFQSTSPVWRTTDLPHQVGDGEPHFNPRPPCGGRLI